ncbi:MAG: DUF6259 domain-containing protein [Defluviitaleaceae bacterium]|nr:DUF6259 domain-containing protein [Defluviitaleaceae bacterium]
MSYSLKSPTLHCEFNRETGALVSVTAAKTGWKILDRPHLGLSFQLMVPLSEELRHNNVLGEKQKLDSVVESKDSLTFHWKGVESERGGKHPINVTIRVAVEGKQIVYYPSIDNKSEYTVEAVHVPYLGDVRPPADAQWLKSFHLVYANAAEGNLWPTFDFWQGYFGTNNPTQYGPRTPVNPYYLMRSQNQGLYVGAKKISYDMVAWAVELKPGYSSSITGEVPKTDEIAGKPVHMPFAAVHMPYVMPGESRDLTPIALEAFQGSWQNGVEIYKKWRDTVLEPAVPPAWARDPHSWLQLHINSPEDELRMRFTELPKVAEECKQHGVKIIQLVGWNDGGQDQGNPSHAPDPRLGTFEELKAAIAKCHEIGVKIMLFTKFTWADRATARFREELVNLAATDPYGDYYLYPGYQYFTPAQWLDINTKRLIPMCFHSERFMEICEEEFMKVVNLGAAGMLYDESQHHGTSWLCFHPDHGHRYGAHVYEKDNDLIRRFRKLPGVTDDFFIAGEASYDWQFETYQLAYLRSSSKTHFPIGRFMQPKAQYMTAIIGFNDRNMVNQCLMFNYIISHEPYNFKGSLNDYPETVAYARKMDDLRTTYRKWFWDGEFRHALDAECAHKNGKAHPTYSVFKAKDGTLGVVVCNYEDEEVSVKVKADNGQAFTKYALVDDAVLHNVGEYIEVPARSAVVVM